MIEQQIYDEALKVIAKYIFAVIPATKIS